MSKAADLDDDEYVAKLLAEDARKSSTNYASQGLSALLPPRRPTGSGLKPNTRFLRTLVREVDSHNAALKKREELEARARLRSIQDEKRSRNDRDRKDHSEHGRHRDGDREKERERQKARGHDRKRRRLSDDEEYDGGRAQRERHERSRKSRRSRSREQEQSRSRERRRRDKRQHDDSDAERRSSRREKRSEHPKSSRLSRSRSWSMSRSRSPAGHRSKRDSDRDADDGERPRHRNKPRNRSVSSTSSDPLSSIVGPDPADKSITTRRRGRGFARGGQSSNIDAHFSSNYNPALDVDADPNSSDDAADWDNALEALRDRRAWRAKQADRLREAGFDEDEIDRWKTTSSQKTRLGDGNGDGDELREVRWSKTGEQREWDAGKPAFGGVDGTSEEDDDGDADHNIATQKKEEKKKPKKRGAETVVAEAWRRKDNGMLKQFRNALG